MHFKLRYWSTSGFWPTDCAYNKFPNELICSREILLFSVSGWNPITRQKRKERRGLHQPMPISGRYSIYKRMEPRKHDSVDWHHRNLGSSRRTSTTLFTLFPIREYIKWKIAQYIIWLRRSLTNYSNNSRKERTLSLNPNASTRFKGLWPFFKRKY